MVSWRISRRLYDALGFGLYTVPTFDVLDIVSGGLKILYGIPENSFNIPKDLILDDRAALIQGDLYCQNLRESE